jgi:hypothetical protein
MLGRELATTYSNSEMMHMLKIHVQENVIDQEAANAMTGALTYKVSASSIIRTHYMPFFVMLIFMADSLTPCRMYQ